MKRVLSPELPQPGKPSKLSENEAHHLLRVMRLGDGDVVEALDGKGHAVLAKLRVRGPATFLEFEGETELSKTTQDGSRLPTIILETAVLKTEAMEWVIEKSVELGIQRLVPLLTAHTVVQVHKKGPEAFQERWQKIADQALKQCGRLEKMQVLKPIDLEERLAQSPGTDKNPRIWCDEAAREEAPYFLDWLQSNPGLSSLQILIGPEGGWSLKERDLLSASSQMQGTSRVHLGSLILRAETAALFTASVAGAHFRKS